MCDCNVEFIGRATSGEERRFTTEWVVQTRWAGQLVCQYPMPKSGVVAEFITIETVIGGKPAILAGFTYE